jgi:hypothetical protein
MAQLDQQQLAQIVQAVISALQVQGQAAPKAAISQPGNSLEAKDRALISGFKRRGIPADQITLMNRADPKAEFNVKPFKLWLEFGRMVRKGERSIRGLFHISQTDALPVKAASPANKPAPKKAKAKPTLPEPTLV